jgi:hypothetical protein
MCEMEEGHRKKTVMMMYQDINLAGSQYVEALLTCACIDVGSIVRLSHPWCPNYEVDGRLYREGISYLPKMFVKLPMALFLGLLFRDRTMAPDFCAFSAWPFMWPFRPPFRVPFDAAFLGFFARPLLWSAIAADVKAVFVADVWDRM